MKSECPPWRVAFSLWLFPSLASGPAWHSTTVAHWQPGTFHALLFTDYRRMLWRGCIWRGQKRRTSPFPARRRDRHTKAATFKGSPFKTLRDSVWGSQPTRGELMWLWLSWGQEGTRPRAGWAGGAPTHRAEIKHFFNYRFWPLLVMSESPFCIL